MPELFRLSKRPNMITRYRHREIAMRINAAQFRAKCLKLIGEVAATRKPIIITKRGKALAKLVPIRDEALRPLFGYMKARDRYLEIS